MEDSCHDFQVVKELNSLDFSVPSYLEEFEEPFRELLVLNTEYSGLYHFHFFIKTTYHIIEDGLVSDILVKNLML